MIRLPVAYQVVQLLLLHTLLEFLNQNYDNHLFDRAELESTRYELKKRFPNIPDRALDSMVVETIRRRRQADKATGLPDVPKLNKGEVYNAEKDKVEAKVGSDLYRKQSNSHAKDFSALQGVKLSTENAIKKIDYILDDKNKDKFELNFGSYYSGDSIACCLSGGSIIRSSYSLGVLSR